MKKEIKISIGLTLEVDGENIIIKDKNITLKDNKKDFLTTELEIVQSQFQYYYIRFKKNSDFKNYITHQTPLCLIYKNNIYNLISHKDTPARIDGLSKFYKDNPEIKVGSKLRATLSINISPMELKLELI